MLKTLPYVRITVDRLVRKILRSLKIWSSVVALTIRDVFLPTIFDILAPSHIFPQYFTFSSPPFISHFVN